MASQKCHQCGSVARCTIHVETVNGQRVVTYLCRACRKELGLIKEDT